MWVRSAALVLLVMALGALGLDASGHRDRPDLHASAMRAVQAFGAEDIDGERWSHADLQGRVFLLDFWATWCAPRLAELPRLKALHARHSREDFEILGISLDVTSRRSFVSWLNRQRVDWPQIHERRGYAGDLPRLFAIESLPATVVIDRHGNVAAVGVRGEALERMIDDLVAAPFAASRRHSATMREER